jgi:hypothetical protein
MMMNLTFMVVLEPLPFSETKILTCLEIMASFNRFFKGTNLEYVMKLVLEQLAAFRITTEEGNSIRLQVKMIIICSFTRHLRWLLRIRIQIISLQIKFLRRFRFRSRKRKLMCLKWWLHHQVLDVALFPMVFHRFSSWKECLFNRMRDPTALRWLKLIK